LHKRCENHDRDEYISTDYLKHKECDDRWVICGCIWVRRKKVGLGAWHCDGTSTGGVDEVEKKKKGVEKDEVAAEM